MGTLYGVPIVSAYTTNLTNIYRPLFATRNQSVGKQSKSRDVRRTRSRSRNGSR